MGWFDMWFRWKFGVIFVKLQRKISILGVSGCTRVGHHPWKAGLTCTWLLSRRSLSEAMRPQRKPRKARRGGFPLPKVWPGSQLNSLPQGGAKKEVAAPLESPEARSMFLASRAKTLDGCRVWFHWRTVSQPPFGKKHRFFIHQNHVWNQKTLFSCFFPETNSIGPAIAQLIPSKRFWQNHSEIVISGAPKDYKGNWINV